MSQINEGAIRTPGVYTTEIPTLPPSVAQVSSAVPVFIGYTQLAQDEVGESLNMVPTKIFSLKDYELYFGFAENETGISVSVTVNTTAGTSIANATIAEPSVHNMYYSLRLYFDNGGGPCYIISIGNTPAALNPDDYTAGLNVLSAADEPTIIVFPEGQSLGEAAYYNTVINQAIEQCRVLQDRFTLVDIHHSLPVAISSPLEPSAVNTTVSP